jgi:hypothetical protein
MTICLLRKAGLKMLLNAHTTQRAYYYYYYYYYYYK